MTIGTCRATADTDSDQLPHDPSTFPVYCDSHANQGAHSCYESHTNQGTHSGCDSHTNQGAHSYPNEGANQVTNKGADVRTNAQPNG